MVEARGGEWKRHWHRERERKKHRNYPQRGGEGLKRVIKEVMSVGDRWIECPKPGLREKEP